jgi:cytochrome c biogenesis protein CcdA
MQQQKSGLFQMGVAITVLGVAVYAALFIGALLKPLAWWAIVAGVILMIIGLVTPGRSRY